MWSRSLLERRHSLFQMAYYKLIMNSSVSVRRLALRGPGTLPQHQTILCLSVAPPSQTRPSTIPSQSVAVRFVTLQDQ